LEKIPFDLSTLPEPLKSMAGNLDPQFIEKMMALYDPATLTVMMNTMFALFKDSLPPEQIDTLKEMMENLMKIMPGKK